jgi:hypothetical protein
VPPKFSQQRFHSLNNRGCLKMLNIDDRKSNIDLKIYLNPHFAKGDEGEFFQRKHTRFLRKTVFKHPPTEGRMTQLYRT